MRAASDFDHKRLNEQRIHASLAMLPQVAQLYPRW